MKEIAVKAAQGKVIVRQIEVPKKKESGLILPTDASIDKKMDMDMLIKTYDYHPLQAIVISNGSPLQLRDGVEHNELEFGDIVILGVGTYDKLLWDGLEYWVIRTSMINGIIKKDSEQYPAYAAALLYDAIAQSTDTIIN